MNHRILRLIALLLSIMLILCMGVGCGKKNEKKKEKDKATEPEGLVVQRTISPAIVEQAVTPQNGPTPPPEQITDPQDAEKPNQSVPTDAVAVAYVNASDINVREKGSSDATILGTLPLNMIVYVTKKDAGNDWSQIDYNGQAAYVATYLLNFISDTPEIKYEGKASFNGDDINIRSESTTDSEVLGKASKGESVDVIKKDAGHDWTMIYFEDKAAFVASRLLTFGE